MLGVRVRVTYPPGILGAQHATEQCDFTPSLTSESIALDDIEVGKQEPNLAVSFISGLR